MSNDSLYQALLLSGGKGQGMPPQQAMSAAPAPAGAAPSAPAGPNPALMAAQNLNVMPHEADPSLYHAMVADSGQVPGGNGSPAIDPKKAAEMQAGATAPGTSLAEGWANLKKAIAGTPDAKAAGK